jgi:hypothetical protein
VFATVLPIRLTVRLLDDDAPWPGTFHAVFADEAGQEHHLTIAPGRHRRRPGAGATPGHRQRTGSRHMKSARPEYAM